MESDPHFPEEVAHHVGVERVAVLRDLITLFVTQKIGGYGDTFQRGKEAVPSRGLARQDDVAGFRVLANEDFLGVEAIRGRQANGLATAVGG